MRLTLPELDCSEGFTNENDIFNRKKLSEKIERIISTCDDESLVLALNDQWGNGKTTFLRMWENEIKKADNFNVIYFDAFQNDFQNDPFIAISSYIYTIIEKPQLKEKYLEATKRVATVLLKTTLKVGISALTLGAVKGTELQDAGDDIKDAINDPIEKYIEDKITQHEQENLTIEKFRSVLSEIAQDKKLIFIIDELDRARPNYSLELLERIKHVFYTKNIFFILSINKEQYKSIIKKTYGEIDTETYLNKFIHLWFTLPKIDTPETKKHTLNIYLNYINRKLEHEYELGSAIQNLTYLLKVNNCSLRDAERCFSQLLIANAVYNKGCRWELQVGLSIIVFLQQKHGDTINRLKNKNITQDELLSLLRIPNTVDKETQYLHAAINTEFMTEEEYAKAKNSKTIPLFNDYFQKPNTLTWAIEIIDDLSTP